MPCNLISSCISAVADGDIGGIVDAISAGADVNHSQNEGESTALMLAVAGDPAHGPGA